MIKCAYCDEALKIPNPDKGDWGDHLITLIQPKAMLFSCKNGHVTCLRKPYGMDLDEFRHFVWPEEMFNDVKD